MALNISKEERESLAGKYKNIIFTLLGEIVKILNTSLKYFYLIITLFSDILVDFRENLSYNGIS